MDEFLVALCGTYLINETVFRSVFFLFMAFGTRFVRVGTMKSFFVMSITVYRILMYRGVLACRCGVSGGVECRR